MRQPCKRVRRLGFILAILSLVLVGCGGGGSTTTIINKTTTTGTTTVTETVPSSTGGGVSYQDCGAYQWSDQGPGTPDLQVSGASCAVAKAGARTAFQGWTRCPEAALPPYPYSREPDTPPYALYCKEGATVAEAGE